MSDDAVSGEPPGDSGADDDAPKSQEVQHQQVSALVPDHVAQGVFSTGAVVLNGPHEFILDFLLRMTRPQQVAARIVLPPPVVPRMIGAIRENLGNYETRFGPVPPAPRPLDQVTPPPQPTPRELYDDLRLADETISGTYANAVMVGHTGTEFSFDFITTFFPRSAVAARVYLAAPNVTRFLESLSHSWDQYQKKIEMARQGQPVDPPTEAEPPTEADPSTE
ncbi:MAG: DUF3467 domain-containing protein [Planctomycetaceae bacterium]|jgi:hypothetical protein|nr:DUF3467 domain-containing protein [Planctomycetaceae bacterium]